MHRQAALLDSEHGLSGNSCTRRLTCMCGLRRRVVPELASRDHIRRVLPLLDRVAEAAERDGQIDAIAVTAGPGLGPARCWWAQASATHWGTRLTGRFIKFITWKGICSRHCCRARHPSFRSSTAGVRRSVRSYCTWAAGEITGYWEKRLTMLRVKHLTRLRNCSSSGIPVAPLYRASPNSAIPVPIQTATADARQRRSELQL